MHVHSLDFHDFSEEDYYLVGIHTAIEDYKLAYLLNNSLKTHFKKASYSLDFQNKKNKASFSVFSYTNEKYDFDWFLISNNYTEESTNKNDTILFSTETKTYLIPEKKNVDYFIKIVGEADYSYLKRSVEKLNEIPQIVTSYLIDKNTLKSKDYLIF